MSTRRSARVRQQAEPDLDLQLVESNYVPSGRVVSYKVIGYWSDRTTSISHTAIQFYTAKGELAGFEWGELKWFAEREQPTDDAGWWYDTKRGWYGQVLEAGELNGNYDIADLESLSAQWLEQTQHLSATSYTGNCRGYVDYMLYYLTGRRHWSDKWALSP